MGAVEPKSLQSVLRRSRFGTVPGDQSNDPTQDSVLMSQIFVYVVDFLAFFR